MSDPAKKGHHVQGKAPVDNILSPITAAPCARIPNSHPSLPRIQILLLMGF
jgi:hypothetical protein